MSPKMESNGGVGAGAMQDCSIDLSSAAPAASPATVVAAAPAMTQAARPADSRRSPPAVKRKTCLRISTSPPVDASPGSNKRATPRNIAVTAGSSSVVASKGMLFSRAELRPAPLSASRKYDGNVGFGLQSTSSSSEMSGSNSNNCSGSSCVGWPAGPGDQAPASSSGYRSEATPPRRPNFNAGSSTSAARPDVRPSDSFATLRIMEARRRAAWSFEPSPRTSSASPPPPSLAALGSRSAGSYRRRSPARGARSNTARKTPMPPLPKMHSFAPTASQPTATAAAAAASAPGAPPPLPPRPRARPNNNPQLLLSAAYCPRGRLASAAATKKVVTVAAPLSEPSGRETLEQKWVAWQLENQQENQNRRGPPPSLGKPAPAPAVPDSGRSASFGGCSGGGGRKGWGGVGDFHDKVALLGDYVASVFGRAKRGGSAPPQGRDAVLQVQYGVE